MRVEEFKKLLFAVCDSMICEEVTLNQLDQYVGDGDHGITIARGFNAVRELLAGPEAEQGEEPETLCLAVGDTLALSMGGAIGPIFGAIFTEGASAFRDTTEIDTIRLADFVRLGLEGVMELGGAVPGDKTLVDALYPASVALEKAAEQGVLPAEALALAAEAAEAGAKRSADLKARKGRARFLGEKSAGYQDAGATSVALMFRAMSRYNKG